MKFLAGEYEPDDNGVLRSRADIAAEHKYSDGDETETRLLDAVRNASDRSLFSPELRRAVTDWPSLYHLSPFRANLLRPFAEFLSTRTILEPGAGCGAVSRFLGETTAGRGGQVVSIESSPRRAAVTRARTEEFTQLSVVAGDFFRIEPGQLFDVVILVGVLEYARLFGSGKKDPVSEFLAHIKKFLKPDGVLFLAIENQLGLKYFAGEKEDHLGIPWFGVNDLYSSRTAVTFGKEELTTALNKAGFGTVEPWMPFPDYKLPSLMLPPRAAKNPEFLAGHLVAETGETERRPVFSLQRNWPVIARNGLLPEMSNSFLMVAGAGKLPEGLADPSVLAWHYTTGRSRPFVKETRFSLEKNGAVSVDRIPLAAGATPPSGHEFSWSCGEKELYLRQPSWWFRLLDILSQDGWTLDALSDWVGVWLRAWMERASAERLTPDLKVTGDLPDATPFNMIVPDDGSAPVFFDLEWHADEPVEAVFILVRSLREAIRKVSLLAPPADRSLSTTDQIVIRVLERFGLSLTQADLNRCSAQEAAFQAMVNDGPYPLNTDERIRFNDSPLRWYEPLSDGVSVEARTQLELRIVQMQKVIQVHEEALAVTRADAAAHGRRAEHLSEEIRMIRESTLWRAGTGIRALAQKYPRISGLMKRLVRRGRTRPEK